LIGRRALGGTGDHLDNRPAAITCGWWNFITPGALGSRISLRRAMAEGTRFGRRPRLTKHQAHEALKRVAAGEPLREIALTYKSITRRLVGQGAVRCGGLIAPGVVFLGVSIFADSRGISSALVRRILKIALVALHKLERY